MGILLPHEDGFSKVKNSYIQNAYYSLCDDCGVDPTETWMYGDWFYTTDYAIFSHEVKATKDMHQTILHDGSLHSQKFLRKRALKREADL